jgi:hypothetical protein
MDISAKRAFIDEQAIELLPREWAVLLHFLKNVGKVISKEQILEAVFGWDDTPASNTIEVYVSRLRAKIAAANITFEPFAALATFWKSLGMTHSLKRQLLLWLLVPLLVIVPIDAALQYWFALAPAEQEFDHQLGDYAIAVSSFVRVTGDHVSFDMAPQAEKLLRTDQLDKEFFLVIGPGGVPIAGDLALNIPVRAVSAGELWCAGKGSLITVRTYVVGQHSILEVEDNGPGMEADEHHRVLQRFVRGRNAVGPGSRLGLAIVSDVARIHQAKLTLETPGGSKGLLVRVLFQTEPHQAC